MKKRGSLYGHIIDVCPAWLDVRLKSGSETTILFKHDMSEKLAAYFVFCKETKRMLEFVVGKNKFGDFMYGMHKEHAAARLSHKTKRLVAEKELEREAEKEFNPVRGKSNKKQAHFSLLPNGEAKKVNYKIRSLVSGSMSEDAKELEFLP